MTRFEIVNHGYEHSQYFQGCGVAFTDFDFVVTGIGENAAEAYRDAVEQLAMADFAADEAERNEIMSALPTRPRGIRARDRVPAECRGEESEVYWFVSIRVKTRGAAQRNGTNG
jgi:hypothetical protein